MIEKKTWKDFRECGMIWFVNRIIHVFGWAIVLQIEEDGSITDVYPARCKFRGFSHDVETDGFKKVSQFMDDNSEILLHEARE